jgi:hypothetical protein
MRIARDSISALRIKLKSFGIPILGPANTYGDNGAVVKNTSIPESTLNKKHNSINMDMNVLLIQHVLRVGRDLLLCLLECR